MNIDFSLALRQLQDMGEGIIRLLPSIIIGLVVFLIFVFIARGAAHLVQRTSARYRRQKNLSIVLGRTVQWLMLLVGFLITAVIVFPNFTPARMIEFLGIGSVAIGFAFRDILQNFLAGILLLITEPFRIGVQIVAGEYEGTVEDIQTRATLLKTYDGRRVVIPNATLFVDSVVVNTAFEERRLQYDVGIGFGDSIEEAKRLVFAALKGCSTVLNTPQPEVLLVDLAASSANLRVRWWIKPPRRQDALDSQDEVLVAIKQTLNEHGIDLPFATYQVLFHDQTEETDGDRTRQREGWPAPAGSTSVPKQNSIAGALRSTAALGNDRQQE